MIAWNLHSGASSWNSWSSWVLLTVKAVQCSRKARVKLHCLQGLLCVAVTPTQDSQGLFPGFSGGTVVDMVCRVMEI